MAILFKDTFTDTNGKSLSSHTADINTTGNPYILSDFSNGTSIATINTNQVVIANGDSYAVVDVGQSDVTIQVVLKTIGDSGQIVFRRNSTDKSYFYAEFNAGGVSVYNVIPNTNFINVGNASYGGITAGAIAKVVLTGTTQDIYMNGVKVLTVTSSVNQTSTVHGVGSGGGGSTFDDLQIDGVSGGGTAYTKTVTDSITLSDAITKRITSNKSLSESIALSEGLIKRITSNKSLSESITLSETITKRINSNKTLTDSLTLTDSVSGSLTGANNYTKTVTDSITLSDSITKRITSNKTLSDLVSLSDTISKRITSLKTISDSIGLNDSMTPLAGGTSYFKTVSDLITLSDSITKQINKLLSDSVSVSDSINNKRFNASKTLSDNLVLTESVTKRYTVSKVLSDSIIITDSVSGSVINVNHYIKSVSDSISLSDSVQAIIIDLSKSIYEKIYLNGNRNLTINLKGSRELMINVNVKRNYNLNLKGTRDLNVNLKGSRDLTINLKGVIK